MFRKLNIIISFLLLTASCIPETKEYVYENSVFRVKLKEQCKNLVGIEVFNLQTASTYSAIPELVVYDDGIPVEGGLVNDYNKLINNDIDSISMEHIYSCVSVYSIFTDSIHLVFGQESQSLGQNKPTNRRLDLGIYDSKLPDFINGNYTLYAVEE